MALLRWVDSYVSSLDCTPWGVASGRPGCRKTASQPAPLYTPEQRRRRDASGWTTVQAVLAPLQFALFLLSLGLVLRFLGTGVGWSLANASVVAKVAMLYAIMVTGSFWERAVFDRWLFAPTFFWEDLFGLLVVGLHTAWLAALLGGWLAPAQLMLLALTAYASYLINAAQFVFKLRSAHRADRLLAGRAGIGAGLQTAGSP